MKTTFPLLFLLVVALRLGSCVGPTEPHTSTQRSAPPSNPNANAIAQRVADIGAGPHSPLPPAERTSVDPTSQIALMVITNDTNYTLTVLYSGPTAQSIVLLPKASRTVSLAVGSYRVAATVDAPNVQPFAGNDDLEGGGYDNTFYIETVRS